MKHLRKWNYTTGEYDPYMVPDDWNVSIYSNNMSEIINCAQCGKALPFGDCYTSKEIHTPVGMGYCVCEDCYDQEWARCVKARQ